MFLLLEREIKEEKMWEKGRYGPIYHGVWIKSCCIILCWLCIYTIFTGHPLTHCIGSKYHISFIFLFKYCSKKSSWRIFFPAHHANHRLFIIIQEGAMHLEHSSQHSPASAESNSPHPSSHSHRLRPISFKKWAGAQWVRDLGTQGSSPSSFGSVDVGRYSKLPPLRFTLLKMGRKKSNFMLTFILAIFQPSNIHWAPLLSQTPFLERDAEQNRASLHQLSSAQEVIQELNQWTKTMTPVTSLTSSKTKK